MCLRNWLAHVIISEHVQDALLGEAGIDVRVDLGNAPRWVHGDERCLMILQFGKGRHLYE